MRILELKKHIGYSYPNYRLRKSFCLLEGIEEECHIFDGQYRLANEKVFEELQTYGIEFDEKRNHSIIKRILNRLLKMKKKLINTAYFYFKKEYGGDTNA